MPEGGAPETIAFPLPFAPELPYQGNLELRFQPHFFNPAADTYFSYAFVWLLEGGPLFDAQRVGSDLTTYYSGLAKSSDAELFDPSAHHASFVTECDGAIRGTVDTQDGFNGGRALHLNVVAEPIACGANTGLIFRVSPHAFGDAVYESRRAFVCNAAR